MTSSYYLISFGCVLFMIGTISAASIADNLVYETPRIHSGDELVQSIVNDCLDGATMSCLKGKVLTYLDTMLNLKEEQGRSFEEKHIDEVIYARIGRILQTNEIRVQMPEIIFQKSVVTYNANNGLDIEIPNEVVAEARGDLLKKKLLLPVLLLLKLKLKALMPIFVALIGLKALKALVLSKLAITLVLGFVVYNLVKKTGLGGSPMSMSPMTPESPMTAYGAPAPTSAPSSSYDPSSWEPSSSGGPYSRVWEPASSASQSLAYSAYYPSSSSSSSGGSSSSLTSSPSSSSSGSSSSLTHSSYA